MQVSMQPPDALWLSLEMRGFRACGLPSMSSDNEGRQRQRVPIARVLRAGGAKRGKLDERRAVELAEDHRQYCLP